MPTSAASAGVLIDLSTRTKLRLTGVDRVRFLNGQVSNDVRKASAAESVYTCVMTIKGKMCADAFVHASGDSLIVDSEPETRDTLAARLERYIIADDVQLEDATEEFHLFHVVPAQTGGRYETAAGQLDQLAGGSPGRDAAIQVVRSSRYGRPGFDLFIPVAQADDYRTALAACFDFASAEDAEVMRIVAGVPRWGAELGEDTMPAEAGLEERAVSYTKGCYIGQEVVSRVRSVGHVNWSLRGFRLVSGDRLEPGMILRGAGDSSGREVGSITSACLLSAPGANAAVWIGLGYARRGSETTGSRLDVFPIPESGDNVNLTPTAGAQSPGAVAQVEVCALPFLP